MITQEEIPFELYRLLFGASDSDHIQRQILVKSVPYSQSKVYNRRYEDILIRVDSYDRIHGATFIERSHFGCRVCDGTSVLLAGGDLIPCTNDPSI